MKNLMYRLITSYMARMGLMLHAFDPNDPADAKALSDAVAAAVEKETAGLKAKRDELLAEVRTLKKGQEVKPEDYARVQDELEAITAERDTLAKQVKDGAKALEKVTKDHQNEAAFTHRLLVENGLTDELVKANVAAPFLPAVKAMLAGKVQIVADGDTRKAMVGDKALADFVAEWAGSDDGKHYVAAPNNTGGGAGGNGKGGGASKVVSRAEFGAMTPVAQSEFMKGGGKVTD